MFSWRQAMQAFATGQIYGSSECITIMPFFALRLDAGQLLQWDESRS